MKQGFAIGAGIIAAGLLLEYLVGPVAWEAFAWPVNIITLLAFVGIIIGIHLLRNSVYAFRFLSTCQAAVPAMSYAAGLTVVMGLTRQTVNGTWLNNMLTFWPFVLCYVYVTFILGLTCLRQVSEKRKTKNGKPSTAAGAAVHFSLFTFHYSLIFHLGLFLALVTATLGNADMQRLKMITAVGEPEWRAIDQQQNIKELPLAIELKHFIMEEYDDGSPRRFASDIQILTKSGKNILATVDVNKPASVDGWKIYQYGYDRSMGAMSQTSIFELVRDPWLPAVYTGIAMMILGAISMMYKGKKTRRQESEKVKK